MDGTLWDGVQTYANGFNEFFKVNRIDRFYIKDNLAKYMGWEQANYLEATMPEFEPEEREQIYNQVIEHQCQLIQKEGGELYNGVKDGLALLPQNISFLL